jgi:hypothetical protein
VAPWLVQIGDVLARRIAKSKAATAKWTANVATAWNVGCRIIVSRSTSAAVHKASTVKIAASLAVFRRRPWTPHAATASNATEVLDVSGRVSASARY